MPDTLTRVADVLDALVALAREIADDPGLDGERLEVRDGPRLSEVWQYALVIGITDGAERPGYSTEISRAEGMGRRKVETVTVRNLLTLSTGDDDALTRLRSQATDLLRRFDSGLRETRTQDQPWQRAAVLGGTEWISLLHEDGSTLSVLFEISAECLL